MNGKWAIGNVVAAGAMAIAFWTPAGAADLSGRPYGKAPPPYMQPISNWSGLYVGGHIGGVTTNEDVTVDGVSVFSTNPSGVAGGVQAGYNYQIAPNFLLGIEGELSWTSANATVDNFKSSHNWYDTLDARAGYAMGSWLLYMKGGVAWMNADYSVPAASINVTRDGWNVGVGAEYMIAPQWSAKAEYNFLNFGSDNLGISRVGTAVNTQVNEFKVGVNYHIAPGLLFGR